MTTPQLPCWQSNALKVTDSFMAVDLCCIFVYMCGCWAGGVTHTIICGFEIRKSKGPVGVISRRYITIDRIVTSGVELTDRMTMFTYKMTTPGV